ncbi:unnamed protein product [Symbiodinium sp. CCMP2592]|nr:unnamed protein product [Symbiodinium sp. CCMP2592]
MEEDFKQDSSREQNNTYAVTADMARQYKALQEELIYKINSLEIQLTEQTEELDLTNFELKELTRDKDDEIDNKDQQIKHLNERMNEMSGEFANMLHETLDLMKHHISDKLSDAALGDADGSRPDFTQRLQDRREALQDKKATTATRAYRSITRVSMDDADFSNKAYNAVAISSKAQGEGSNKAVRREGLRLQARPQPAPTLFERKSEHKLKLVVQGSVNRRRCFPPDLGLLQMADDIVVRFQAKPAEAHPPEGFFNYICGLQEWPLPNQFCLLGYVSALFVRARHLMLEEGERETANSDLAYAEPILGKEISLDFLDSSPWPVSILDIFLNINQTEFLTYAQYAAKNPVRPPSVPLESLHWQPPPDLVQRLSQVRTPSDVSVAVFGTHATLSLEPVDMLTRSQGFFRVKATFFGLEPRWCEILGLCNQGSSTITQLLRAAEEDPYAYPWDTMSQHLSAAAAGDQALREAQLLLCTEPVAGCVMLRQWASRERGATLPMLGYYGVALLNGCPPQDVKTFWRGFSELLDSGSMARMATNNLILSEQIFYQTGRRLPYVRAHGLYTEVSYSPKLLDQVLFWRSPLFAYATLRCAMFRFLEGFGQYPLKFYFLEGSESVPYAKAVSYRAIAMLPHDHALMSFYELYSTATPLLLPSAEWMYRLLYMRGQLSVGERWYQSIMPGHEPPYCEFEVEGGAGAGNDAQTEKWNELDTVVVQTEIEDFAGATGTLVIQARTMDGREFAQVTLDANKALTRALVEELASKYPCSPTALRLVLPGGSGIDPLETANKLLAAVLVEGKTMRAYT